MEFVFQAAYTVTGNTHKTAGPDFLLFEGTDPKTIVRLTTKLDEHLYLLDRQTALATMLLAGLIGQTAHGNPADKLQQEIQAVRDRRRNAMGNGRQLLIEIRGDVGATVEDPKIEIGDFVICFDAYPKRALASLLQPRLSTILAALRTTESIELGFQNLVQGSYLIDEGKVVHSFSGELGSPNVQVSQQITDEQTNLLQQSLASILTGEKLGTALSEEKVVRALRLRDAATSLEWVDLYRLYEVIESDVPSREMQNKGWVTRKQIERFKRTANSQKTIGDQARHGRDPRDPPPKPISLSQARLWIDGLLKAWLHHKGGGTSQRP